MAPQPRGIRADIKLSYLGVEKIAARIRDRLARDLPMDAQMSGVEVFESLSDHSVPLGRGSSVPLDCAVKELPDGVEGETRYDKSSNKIVVTLSEATYEALECGRARARQTLYHEISHAAVHPQQVIRLSIIPHATLTLQRAATPTHRFFQDTEWQADAVGASILMPATGIALLESRHGYLTARLLQQVFLVSAESATIRLNVFTERRHQLLQQ